jgi:hypothetical protein
MQNVSLATPLFVGAAIKIANDIALFVSFRKIRPPEELLGGKLCHDASHSAEL